MISKNILSLIEKYKENGTFVLIKNKIYWFNGKRLELWHIFPSIGKFRILLYKDNLYCCNELGLLFIFKHLQFEVFFNEYSPLLSLFENNRPFTYFEDHLYIKKEDDKIYDENGHFLVRSAILSKMVATKNHLFLFGHAHIYIKVNFQKDDSSYLFSSQLIDNLCLFQDTIYAFDGISFREIA